MRCSRKRLVIGQTLTNPAFGWIWLAKSQTRAVGWWLINEYSCHGAARSGLTHFILSGSSEQNVGSGDATLRELYSSSISSYRPAHRTVSSGYEDLTLTRELAAFVRKVCGVTCFPTNIMWQSWTFSRNLKLSVRRHSFWKCAKHLCCPMWLFQIVWVWLQPPWKNLTNRLKRRL